MAPLPGHRFFRYRDALRAFIARKIWLRPAAGRLLKLLGWARLEIVQLSRESRNYFPTEIEAAGAEATFQNWPRDGEVFFKKISCEIGLWKLSDTSVVLNTKFPAVRVSGKLLIQPRAETGPYHLYPSENILSEFGVYMQSGSRVLFRDDKTSIEVPEAIYCGTRAPSNWGHWLMNFLPGVMVAKEFFGDNPSPPLIVPPGYDSGESRAALFNYFWGDRPVIVCEPRTVLKVEELYWFEQPVADSPRPVDTNNLKPKALNLATMARFRKNLLDYAGVQSYVPIGDRNLFLAREPGRRDYNHDEIHDIASAKGYEILYPNRLEISEQISTFSQARRIVGPIGSAFANVLFAGPGAEALVLCRPNDGEHWWAPFGLVAQVAMYGSYREGSNINPWDLDPTSFGELLDDFDS